MFEPAGVVFKETVELTYQLNKPTGVMRAVNDKKT
jgi:hypothetical protein